MSNGNQPPHSIAAELAPLYLRELELKVADDPELLVTTEAVLSFAAIRHADPPAWHRWREIPDKYEKADLVKHMFFARSIATMLTSTGGAIDEVAVGIDVSKAGLDVAVTPSDAVFSEQHASEWNCEIARTAEAARSGIGGTGGHRRARN